MSEQILPELSEPTKEDKPRITVYHGIFEDKFRKLVRDIKRLRKEPDGKHKVTKLIEEAKSLQKLVKKERKKHPIKYSIRLIQNDQSGDFDIVDLSSQLKIVIFLFENGIIDIEFNVDTIMPS